MLILNSQVLATKLDGAIIIWFIFPCLVCPFVKLLSIHCFFFLFFFYNYYLEMSPIYCDKNMSTLDASRYNGIVCKLIQIHVYMIDVSIRNKSQHVFITI